jgi:hypothetical protein
MWPVTKPCGRSGVGSTQWYAIFDVSSVDYERCCEEGDETGTREGPGELEEGLSNSVNSMEGEADFELINLVRSESFPNRGVFEAPLARGSTAHLNQVWGEEAQDIPLNLANKLSKNLCL